MLATRSSESHWNFCVPRVFKWTLACVVPVAVGVFSGRLPSIAMGLAVVFALIALAFLPLPIIVIGVVLSAFVSRISIEVAGGHLHPENFATIVLLLAVLIRGRGGHLLKQGLRSPAVYLLLYVAYSAYISILIPGTFIHGFNILIWLLLDWILFSALLTANPPRQVMYNAIAWGSGLAAILALVLWLLAETTGQSLGVDRGLFDLVPAVYGLSFEPNILAGALLLSVMVLLSAPSQYIRRWHTSAVVIALIALPFTQTRAAVLGLAAGLIVLLVRSRERSVRRRVWRTSAAVTGIAAVALIAGWRSGPLMSKFLGIVDFSSGNGAYRLGIQGLALNDLHDTQSWVFGLGANSFSLRHTDFSRPELNVGAFLANLPLQVTYDSGIIGFCLISLLAIALLRSSHFSASSLAVVVAFTIVAAATSPFWFATTWIFAALAVLPREPDSVAGSPDRAKMSASQESVVRLAADWSLKP